MMNFKFNFIVYLFLAFPLVSIGQNSNKKDIKLYAFMSGDMFSASTLKYFKNNNILSAKLLTDDEIEPKGEGQIDTFNIKRYMTLFYPDSTSYGTCVIDVEDSAFYNLRKNVKLPAFIKEESWFVSVLNILKKYRPNVSFGIYGLPFTIFYPQQMEYNEGQKFDNLFKHCDFIAPSFYIDFPDQEIGHERNIQYLKENLQLALDYGYRLNKPVIPFIWELIHPSNKKFGGMIIPKDEYLDYVNFLVSYKYNQFSLTGLFLWNPGKPSPVYYKGAAATNSKVEAIHNRDSLIIEYYNGIFKVLNSK